MRSVSSGKPEGLESRKGLLGCQIYKQNLHISVEGSCMYSICDNIQSFRVKESSCLKTNFVLVTFISMCQP